MNTVELILLWAFAILGGYFFISTVAELLFKKKRCEVVAVIDGVKTPNYVLETITELHRIVPKVSIVVCTGDVAKTKASLGRLAFRVSYVTPEFLAHLKHNTITN
ncbi:MAG: hypothetical protein PHG02_09320 [Oscillospiraceae bacterium]|nr:hypothetical protein [Oscillospiraceae bacterium]